MTIANHLKRFEKLIQDNSPTILTAIGVTGTITTAVLTGKATFKAAQLISEEVEERKYLDLSLMEPKDVIKLVWKLYIPALGVGTLTCASIIGANRIGTRRAAAMAAAYSISERAFQEYKEKVVEKIGENQERKVRDELAQDRVNRTSGKNEVIITGGGDVMCFDTWTGRYFRSDMETLKKAQNDLNYRLLNHDYASLNDFYEKIGLAQTKEGNEVGWRSDNPLELSFSTTMSDDQKPCIAIDFVVKPVRDYFRVH